ncbi:hypothetical protein INT47_003393 [Mucor saturninus]|uniref:No apical meristem-associated C-terminal domain-containing protein n=1 Tax=Mucor saturninus TaxID=64648 RepID=A0A8H7RG15_9FUNG|nr:hypothetical protein INT47_003393 [Mucor saturninus]
MDRHLQPTIPENTGHGSNWSEEEDKQLCNSVLSAEKGCLVVDYNKNIGDRATEVHSDTEMISRWDEIDSSVQKFIGFYDSILRFTQKIEPRPTDLLEKTHIMYKASFTTEPEPFIFEHCLPILSVEPKWALHNMPRATGTKKRSIDELEKNEFGGVSIWDIPRPMGYKRVRALRKRALEEEEIAARQQELKELREETVRMMAAQRLAIQEEKLRLAEHRIMMKDLSIITDPQQHAYYKIRQEQILQEMIRKDNDSVKDVKKKIS